MGSFRPSKKASGQSSESNIGRPRRGVQVELCSLFTTAYYIASKLTAWIDIYYLIAPVGQEIRSSLAEWFCFRVTHEVSQDIGESCNPWRLVWDWGPANRRAHIRNGWQEASVLTMGPFHRASWESSWHLARFSHSSNPRKREQKGSHQAFEALIWEVIHCHLHHILFVRSEPPSPAHTQWGGELGSTFWKKNVDIF